MNNAKNLTEDFGDFFERGDKEKGPVVVEGYGQSAIREAEEITARTKAELKMRMEEAMRTDRFKLRGATEGDIKQMLPNILFSLAQDDSEFKKAVNSFPKSIVLLEEVITELLGNK